MEYQPEFPSKKHTQGYTRRNDLRWRRFRLSLRLSLSLSLSLGEKKIIDRKRQPFIYIVNPLEKQKKNRLKKKRVYLIALI